MKRNEPQKIKTYFFRCRKCGENHLISIPIGKQIPLFITCGKCGSLAYNVHEPLYIHSKVAVTYRLTKEHYLLVEDFV